MALTRDRILAVLDEYERLINTVEQCYEALWFVLHDLDVAPDVKLDAIANALRANAPPPAYVYNNERVALQKAAPRHAYAKVFAQAKRDRVRGAPTYANASTNAKAVALRGRTIGGRPELPVTNHATRTVHTPGDAPLAATQADHYIAPAPEFAQPIAAPDTFEAKLLKMAQETGGVLPTAEPELFCSVCAQQQYTYGEKLDCDLGHGSPGVPKDAFKRTPDATPPS